MAPPSRAPEINRHVTPAGEGMINIGVGGELGKALEDKLNLGRNVGAEIEPSRT